MMPATPASFTFCIMDLESSSSSTWAGASVLTTTPRILSKMEVFSFVG